jgi:cellulose synthase/poly-beta-1,6-N-acetylglucosamine synthase-like glycosyltransferase
MTLSLVSTCLHVAGLGLCAYAVLLLLPDAYLATIHLVRSRPAVARERAQIAAGLAPGAEPRICVQLPVFNEPALIGSAIDALAALDWPRDRLEIMVLDDSTDETASTAAARVAQWRAAGLAISHVRRSDRAGFKAGALAAGLARTDAAYIAIFDTDYRPSPSFLRETLAVLLREPRAAFVQARLDHRNRAANALTRAQALELDTFFAYEQAARHWAGVPINFNGTCGVWRRAAIDAGGGWSARSLVEDQDLSFRAFSAGWTCLNLVSVPVAGELPERFAVLAVQRARWGAGTAQTFRSLSWRLLHHLGPIQATLFVLLAQFYAGLWLLLCAIAAVAAVTGVIDPARGADIGVGLAIVVALIVLAKSVGAALATRLVGRRLGLAFLFDLVGMWLMEAALLPVIGWALARGYFSRQMAFKRTPKLGR